MSKKKTILKKKPSNPLQVLKGTSKDADATALKNAPQVIVSGASKPLPAPPSNLNALQKNKWKRLSEACPFLNACNAELVRIACIQLCELERLDLFFANRCKSYKRDKQPEMQAFMQGEKEHPLSLKRQKLQESVKRTLAELGMTPKEQFKMQVMLQESNIANLLKDDSNFSYLI